MDCFNRFKYTLKKLIGDKVRVYAPYLAYMEIICLSL